MVNNLSSTELGTVGLELELDAVGTIGWEDKVVFQFLLALTVKVLAAQRQVRN